MRVSTVGHKQCPYLSFTFRSNGSRWRVLDRVGDLAFHGRTGLTVCDTNLKRQTTRSKIPPLSNPEIEENWQVPSSLWRHPISISNFLPTREKKYIKHKSPSAHIAVCKPRAAAVQSETVATPSTLYVEVALCLNWIDECIVTAIFFFPFFCFCLFVFFLFIMLLSCKSMFKGKILTLLWESGGVSVDLQFVLHIRVLSLSPVSLWKGLSAQTSTPWD